MRKKFKHTDRTKFIIFGQGRSGSNLLVDLLNSHPDIHCDREPLNNQNVAQKNILLRSFIYRFPYRYIQFHLNKYAHKIYGFKLMIYQLVIFKKIKPKLFNRHWKIIYLKREDVLQQSLSAIIAKKTGLYMRTTADKHEDQRVFYVELQKLVNELFYRTRDLEREQVVLQGVDFLELVYEHDLEDSKKWQATANRVFAYLGLKPVEVSASILKTNSLAHEKRISNYQEIIDHLKNTDFSYLV